ncbi:hypothetical protein HanPSC8_Chr02g0050171 [Helianthus annuus]|nr:hypothetical protein HanPSC8_Chr02g0050171 [Helianthus annuus]
MNLSGLNSSGSVHDAGSLPIAQALIITCVRGGMSYPIRLTPFLASRARSKGSGACNRKASFTTALRYGIFSKSSSGIIGLPCPTSDTSCCNFFITLGCFISSLIAQSRLENMVSDPATNTSYHTKITAFSVFVLSVKPIVLSF